MVERRAGDSRLELRGTITARLEVAIGTKNAFFQRLYLEMLPILLNNYFWLILEFICNSEYMVSW